MRIWSGVESAERGSKNGHNPKSTPSTRLRIGITSMLAAGGELPARKSDSYIMYNWDNGGHVSRKLLIVTVKGLQRQPDHDTVWGRL